MKHLTWIISQFICVHLLGVSQWQLRLFGNVPNVFNSCRQASPSMHCEVGTYYLSLECPARMSSYSCQSIFRSTSEFTATLQGTSSPGSSQLVENGLQYHGLLCWHRVRADRVWEHRYQKPTANQGLPVVEVRKFKYNGRQLARGDCGLEFQSIFRNHGFLFSIFTGLELDQESAEFYCNETNEVSFPCLSVLC